MTDEEWKNYILGLPREEKQRGVSEWIDDTLKSVNSTPIKIGVDNKQEVKDPLNRLIEILEAKHQQKSEVRKLNDMENKNRKISLYGDKLPSKIQEQAIDEIDNRLGIKTDKKLVEYGQYVVDSMSKGKLNLNVDNISQKSIDESKRAITNPIPKPKLGIEKVVDKLESMYENQPIKGDKKGDRYYLKFEKKF